MASDWHWMRQWIATIQKMSIPLNHSYVRFNNKRLWGRVLMMVSNSVSFFAFFCVISSRLILRFAVVAANYVCAPCVAVMIICRVHVRLQQCSVAMRIQQKGDNECATHTHRVVLLRPTRRPNSFLYPVFFVSLWLWLLLLLLHTYMCCSHG